MIYFKEQQKEIKTDKARSQVHDIDVWDAHARVDAGDESTLSLLGFPVDLVAYMALVKMTDAWMGPIQGKKSWLNHKDGFLLQYLRKDGLHVAVLPLAGVGDSCTTHVVADHDGKRCSGDTK